MNLDEFDYYLPDNLIAQVPAEPAHNSKLLVFDKGSIQEYPFWKIVDLLTENDVVIFNDSKVYPARVSFMIDEQILEVFFLKSIGDFHWQVLLKPAKYFKKRLRLNYQGLDLHYVGEISEGVFEVAINLKAEDLSKWLEVYGSVPLPPYIKTQQAAAKYQNVYAHNPGSVAVPTAGLHFTKEVLRKLQEKNIEILFVTLHVGIGTFRPIKVKRIEQHQMHSEHYSINFHTAQRLNLAKQHNKRILAVGTTVCRVLEDNFGKYQQILPGQFETNIFIHPGIKFGFVDSLITNFHLPKSSLLLLVAAFVGIENARRIYQYAVNRRWRFFSFGDVMWLK